MSFQKALKAHNKLINNNADTTDMLPTEILDDYDRAISKCNRLLKIYPKDVKWHDDAEFIIAKSLYMKREYLSSVRHFQVFVKDYPSSPFIPEAYYLLASGHLELGELESAEKHYQYILQKYPDMNKEGEITYQLSMVSVKKQGKAQALQILEESLGKIQSEKKKLDIIIEMSNLYIELKMYEKAIDIIAKAPKTKDFVHRQYTLSYNKYRSYKELEQLETALSLILEMKKNSSFFQYKDNLVLEHGIILLLQKEYKKALSELMILTQNNDSSPLAGDAWYYIAVIYYDHLKDYRNAEESFKKVQSLNNDPEIKKIAEQRLAGMRDKRFLKSKISSLYSKKDSVSFITRDSSQYLLGENYWYNLAQPDSALKIFTELSQDSSASDSVVQRALYAQSWIFRNKKNDRHSADSICNMIFNTYPATEVAKQAQRDLGIEVTIMTRRDSALAEIAEAEKLHFDENKTVEAVNKYGTISKKYSDLPDLSVRALYIAAWLCDDVLNKNRTALKLYKEICEKFPDSQYCLNNVKPRIQAYENKLNELSQDNSAKKQDEEPVQRGE